MKLDVDKLYREKKTKKLSGVTVEVLRNFGPRQGKQFEENHPYYCGRQACNGCGTVLLVTHLNEDGLCLKCTRELQKKEKEH